MTSPVAHPEFESTDSVGGDELSRSCRLAFAVDKAELIVLDRYLEVSLQADV